MFSASRASLLSVLIVVVSLVAACSTPVEVEASPTPTATPEVETTDGKRGEEPWKCYEQPKEGTVFTDEWHRRAFEGADQIRDLAKRQPNYNSDYIGMFRDENGEKTGDGGIIVRVYPRVPDSEIPPEDRLPDCVNGIPIEIREAEIPEVQKLSARGDHHRPLMGGIKIANALGHRGTLTGVARRNVGNIKVLVTALHVITGPGREPLAAIGDPIYQLDHTNSADKVGELLGWVPQMPLPHSNICDVGMTSIEETAPGVAIENSYAPHKGDPHEPGPIVAGVVEPKMGDDLIFFGGVSGVGTVRVEALNQPVTSDGFGYTGAVELDTSSVAGGLVAGDSGSPLVVRTASGKYRMSCFLFARFSDTRAYAYPASVAQRELDITFGEEAEMPELTTEGFVGKRWIIDDYFKAGETLHAGDVVGIDEKSPTETDQARVFKINGTVDTERVVGIVHTPSGGSVGDVAAANADDFVSVVVKGVAKTLSAGNIDIGDPVIPSGDKSSPAVGKGEVARVEKAMTHNHSPGDDDETGEKGRHTHTLSVLTPIPPPGE